MFSVSLNINLYLFNILLNVPEFTGYKYDYRNIYMSNI